MASGGVWVARSKKDYGVVQVQTTYRNRPRSNQMSPLGILFKCLARFGEEGFGHFDVCGPALLRYISLTHSPTPCLVSFRTALSKRKVEVRIEWID
jgi:hypothetical protein